MWPGRLLRACALRTRSAEVGWPRTEGRRKLQGLPSAEDREGDLRTGREAQDLQVERVAEDHEALRQALRVLAQVVLLAEVPLQVDVIPVVAVWSCVWLFVCLGKVRFFRYSLRRTRP